MSLSLNLKSNPMTITSSSPSPRCNSHTNSFDSSHHVGNTLYLSHQDKINSFVNSLEYRNLSPNGVRPLFLSLNPVSQQSYQEFSPPDNHRYHNESDIMEVPLDPFDNTSGEQHFCGGYGEWGHVVNHTNRTILPDLKPYPFPIDIKNQADVIYNKMRYQVRRGKVRHQMLFFCVYYAHIELGIDADAVQLGAQFGLTQGEVQRCDSLFSPLQTGYKPPSIKISPLGYLPGYCENMNLSQDAVIDIKNMAANILKKDPSLFQENPQTVAAGILRYYTITNGITTDDPQKITRVTGRSTVTIDGMFRRISTIDNN